MATALLRQALGTSKGGDLALLVVAGSAGVLAYLLVPALCSREEVALLRRSPRRG